jgi:hypothetical protein
MRGDRTQHRLQLQGRADLPADRAERLQLLDRALELAIEARELLAGAVDVRGERAQLVAVGDMDALGELAGRDLTQAPGDPGERLHDRP